MDNIIYYKHFTQEELIILRLLMVDINKYNQFIYVIINKLASCIRNNKPFDKTIIDDMFKDCNILNSQKEILFEIIIKEVLAKCFTNLQ